MLQPLSAINRLVGLDKSVEILDVQEDLARGPRLDDRDDARIDQFPHPPLRPAEVFRSLFQSIRRFRTGLPVPCAFFDKVFASILMAMSPNCNRLQRANLRSVAAIRLHLSVRRLPKNHPAASPRSPGALPRAP